MLRDLLQPEQLDDGFEPVIMVYDFWDQPRAGVAMRRGEVMRFMCRIDEELDDYPSRYLVSPINESMFLLELEAYELYFRHPPSPDVFPTLQEGHAVFPEAEVRFNEINQQLIVERNLMHADCESAEPFFKPRLHASKFWAKRRLWQVRW